MQAQGAQQILERLLTQEVQCSEALLACINAEREALSTRDSDALQCTTTDKLEYTRQLESLEREREQLLHQQGFNIDAEGLKQCAMTLPRSNVLIALWKQVLKNISDCRTGNLTNGSILESSRQHVEQALCLLRGQAGAPKLYSASGDAGNASLGHRELGKA